MLCTIIKGNFHLFTKNTWIGTLGATCHNINNNTGLYDVTDINKLVQGSSDNRSTIKMQTPHEGI